MVPTEKERAALREKLVKKLKDSDSDDSKAIDSSNSTNVDKSEDSSSEGPLMTEAQFMKKQKDRLEAEAKHKAALHKKQAEKELETQ